MSGRCTSCSAPVEWALTHNFKRMPIDAAPAPDPTNLIAWRDTDGEIHVRDRDGIGATDAPSDARYATSHFATCPNADQFRKRKAAR